MLGFRSSRLLESSLAKGKAMLGKKPASETYCRARNGLNHLTPFSPHRAGSWSPYVPRHLSLSTPVLSTVPGRSGFEGGTERPTSLRRLDDVSKVIIMIPYTTCLRRVPLPWPGSLLFCSPPYLPHFRPISFPSCHAMRNIPVPPIP